MSDLSDIPTPEQIERLDREIEMEQASYETACKFPTETAQFYRGLENTRKRIQELRLKRAKMIGKIDE